MKECCIQLFTLCPHTLHAKQGIQTKSSEIDSLLSRLSDVNESMRSTISSTSDSRAHTLARHRDILHDFTQEFRRLSSIVGAARDRAELLGGQRSEGRDQSSMGLLLRERNMLATSNAAVGSLFCFDFLAFEGF